MHKLNLLPKEVLINQSKKKYRLLFILIMTILSVLLISSVVFFNKLKVGLEKDIYNASQDITDIKSKMRSRDKQEQILKDYEKRQNIYEDLMKNRINYSKTLGQVLLLMPKEVTVMALRIDASNCLTIDGHAPSNAYVARIIKDIKKLNGIIDVSLGFTRLVEETKDETCPRYHFEIVILLTED